MPCELGLDAGACLPPCLIGLPGRFICLLSMMPCPRVLTAVHVADLGASVDLLRATARPAGASWDHELLRTCEQRSMLAPAPRCCQAQGGARCPDNLPFGLCPRLWDEAHVPTHLRDDAAIYGDAALAGR